MSGALTGAACPNIRTVEDRARTTAVGTGDSTWQKILDEVIVKDDPIGTAEWVISVDSVVVFPDELEGGFPPTH